MAAAAAATVMARRGPGDGHAGKVVDENFQITPVFVTLFSDTAAIPPPSSLSSDSIKPPDKNEEKDGESAQKYLCINLPSPFCVYVIIVVHSALEELSKKKAEKTGPFARPKMLVVSMY